MSVYVPPPNTTDWYYSKYNIKPEQQVLNIGDLVLIDQKTAKIDGKMSLFGVHAVYINGRWEDPKNCQKLESYRETSIVKNTGLGFWQKLFKMIKEGQK